MMIIFFSNDNHKSSLSYQGSRASGAFILTASHNPGGPHEVVIIYLLLYLFSILSNVPKSSEYISGDILQFFNTFVS